MYAEIISDANLKCRKPRLCHQCHRPIQAGEMYRRQVYKEGDLYTYSAHVECDKAANRWAQLAGLSPTHDDWPILANDLCLDDYGWIMQEFPIVAARFNIQGPIQPVNS